LTPLDDHCIYVIDDDPSIRKALHRLLLLNRYNPRLFSSAEDFLSAQLSPNLPGCLLVDIRMPGMSGLELQKALLDKGLNLPIIFLTGYGTVPMSVQALKLGAFDFLEKPFDANGLLLCVEAALTKSRRVVAEADQQRDLARKFNTLTLREKQVLGGLARGQLNKEIAADLGIVEKTVKVHRASLKAKMEVDSLAELLQLYQRYQSLADQEEMPRHHPYQFL
jgi:FixJ family two-component response regulator